MKSKEFADLFHFKEKSNYWLHHIIKKRKRRTKLFPLHAYLNKGTNKMKLSKKTRRKLKSGNEKSISNLVTRQTHKFKNYIMVSGGICDEELGK